MKLRLRYETSYRYEEAVAFTPHEVRLFPRGDYFSRVMRIDFRTEPEATIRFSRDVFDNVVASCFFPLKSDLLRVELSIDVALEQKDPFQFLLEHDAINTPFTYDAKLMEVLAPYLARPGVETLRVPGWLPPTPEQPRATASALVELNRALHDCVGYEAREDGPVRSAAETLRLGRGAARDVAVVHAQILRGLGLAARLTSGYLRETDGEVRRAEGSLHVWTEVFLPGAGWVGIDATNAAFCNHNFIAAAVGLTTADITPISGSYFHQQRVPAEMTSGLEVLNL
ncbi:MAG: transglutaminase family protein [Verrucomicrobiota bacterium]|nr:transglutaminase family protein [Verrucomicrobiota bacterium]